MKQEPRPAYHRRKDLERLRERALGLPVIVTDLGRDFAVLTVHNDELLRGRYQIIATYLQGWIDAQGSDRRDTTSDAAMRAMTEGNFK